MTVGGDKVSLENQLIYGANTGGRNRRWTFYIDAEGIIRKIDKQINPLTAGTDLVRNLEALGFPKK